MLRDENDIDANLKLAALSAELQTSKVNMRLDILLFHGNDNNSSPHFICLETSSFPANIILQQRTSVHRECINALMFFQHSHSGADCSRRQL